MSRTIKYSIAFPPRKDAEGRYLCRTCGVVLDGRKTSFCSQACRDDALIRCWPSEARRQVKARDKEVCAGCGLDCAAAKKIIQTAGRECWGQGVRWNGQIGRISGYEAVWQFLATKPRSHLWEANHIVPVVEGSGGCGLDNLETLCIWCHRDHTAELRRRMAMARRLSSGQLEIEVEGIALDDSEAPGQRS